MKKRMITSAVLITVFMFVMVSGCTKKEKKAENLKIVTSETLQQAEPETKEESETTEEAETKEEPKTEDIGNGIVIALDPGHQGWDVDMSAKEPNAPDSTVMKTKATTGTQGEYSNVPEYQLVLDISLRVRDKLVKQGYDVIMTREDNDTAISNAERATKANDAGADAMIRIHANSSENHSANGALALVSSQSNPYVGKLYDESYKLADCILQSYCQSTNMKNDGIQENDTMTGINWSKIPVMILEMGFMSNKTDDLNMADETYRDSMVNGIVDGINKYYGQTAKENKTESTELEKKLAKIVQRKTNDGERWSVYVKNLSNGSYATVQNQKMESASLIKLFVAGAVYENRDTVQKAENWEGETEELLKKMIMQSDNDAANTLVKRLGSGDVLSGMKVINTFCETHEYVDTHMGRLMLESNEEDDNYTTVEDCGKILEDLYNTQLEGSSQIISYMKQQENGTKIPAGLPADVAVANKTGELDDVENDVAIIEKGDTKYLLCVMSNKVGNPQSAKDQIIQISKRVYENMMK